MSTCECLAAIAVASVAKAAGTYNCRPAAMQQGALECYDCDEDAFNASIKWSCCISCMKHMHAGFVCQNPAQTSFETICPRDSPPMALPMPRCLSSQFTVSSSSTSSPVRRLPSRQISSRCRPLWRRSWVISAAAASPPPDSSGSSSAGPRFNPFKRKGKKEVGLHRVASPLHMSTS